MIKKQSLLNDIFLPKPNTREDHQRKNSITKFIQCFNNSTGKRSRQIRILQIGNSSYNNKFDYKAYSKSQALRNPPHSALLNNQILFKTGSGEEKQKFFFVEGVRKKDDRKIQSGIIKYKEKKDNNRNTFVSRNFSSSSQYRTKGWAIRNKNIQEIPTSFSIKNSHLKNTSSIIPQKIGDTTSCQIQITKTTQIQSPTNSKNQTSSKSVNILNKIKTIEQDPFNQFNQGRTIQVAKNLTAFNNKKSPQELIQEERKAKLQIKKQINIQYAKPFNPPTNISAFAYAVYEPTFSAKKQKKKIIFQKIIDEGFSCLEQNVRLQSKKNFLIAINRTQVEVASLTKIMTCILAIQICNKFKLDSKHEEIQIGKFQSEIGGTTAELSAGQIYTLQDLYYGLMLPSGNDASVAIAVWGGRNLLNSQSKSVIKNYKKKECYSRFIEQMNKLSKKIGMQKTTYANSHGLANPQNKSCAFDLCVLCEYAMNNTKFKEIVSTRAYNSTIRYTLEHSSSTSPRIQSKSRKTPKITNKSGLCDDQQLDDGEDIDMNLNQQEIKNEESSYQQQKQYLQKQIGWQNTHRLLQQKPNEYTGIKTGITTAAGPCLASCVKNSSGRYFIIIVLNCQKMSMRFKDTENLKKWAFQREGLTSPKKKSKLVNDINKALENKLQIEQN